MGVGYSGVSVVFYYVVYEFGGRRFVVGFGVVVTYRLLFVGLALVFR